jgi:NDP-sugar pyrophosphorylase family protein
VLGRLAASLATVRPARIAANASRCPDLVEAEVERASGRACELVFEPVPQGSAGTMAGISGSASGTWIVSNTDMVVDVDPAELARLHAEAGNDWTVLAGPPMQGYGRLPPWFGGLHYWGISVMEARVLALAAEAPGGGVFSAMAGGAARAGLRMGIFEGRGRWIDTGAAGSYRTGLLSEGSYVHPGASIAPGAFLAGSWFVSEGCEIMPGAVLEDSVMLPGSLLHGSLRGGILPWYEEG